jgi:hypothetical protein
LKLLHRSRVKIASTAANVERAAEKIKLIFAIQINFHSSRTARHALCFKHRSLLSDPVTFRYGGGSKS